jgi:hypothetical protein
MSISESSDASPLALEPNTNILIFSSGNFSSILFLKILIILFSLKDNFIIFFPTKYFPLKNIKKTLP